MKDFRKTASGNIVYKFLDKEEEVIYIGRTKNLISRIASHFSKNGNIETERLREINEIKFTKVPSKIESEILEKYLINKFKPKLNKADICDEEIRLLEFKNNFTWVSYPRRFWKQDGDVFDDLVFYDEVMEKEYKLIYEEPVFKNRYFTIRNHSNAFLTDSRDYTTNHLGAKKFQSLNEALVALSELDNLHRIETMYRKEIGGIYKLPNSLYREKHGYTLIEDVFGKTKKVIK